MTYPPASVQLMSDSTRHADATDGDSADWVEFVLLLQSRIAAIEPGGSLALDLSEVAGDWAPYVQIAKSPDGDELYTELSSNEFLDESFAMTPNVVNSLVDLGWYPPVSGGSADDRPSFFLYTNVGSEEGLASTIVVSFRTAFPELDSEILTQAIEDDQLSSEGQTDWPDPQGASDTWADFCADLETRVLNIAAPASIEVRVDQSLGDSSPTITAYPVSDGRAVVVEVSSNQTFPPHARLSPTQIGTLLT